MPTVFLLKIGVGLLLFLIHIETYGIDELSHDGETFLREGKYLNDVFFKSTKDYFQLLTGIGESTELVNKYLSMTEYWSAGDLTLINDSKNVIRVHSIIHFFSGNSVLIHLSLMCLLTLGAVKNLYISFRKYSKLTNTSFYWMLVLIPSTIFWTSSILKEPFLFFGLSLLCRSILVNDKILKRFIIFILSLAFLILFKPYILICAFAALVAMVIYSHLFKNKLILSVTSMLGFICIIGLSFQNQRDQIVNHLTRKQFDFENVGKGGLHVLAKNCFYYFKPGQYNNLTFKGNQVILLKETDAFIIHFGSVKKPIKVHLTPNGESWEKVYFTPGCGSYIEITPINNSMIQLVKNIPESLINSALRPFPTDPGSNLKFLSFFEIWYIVLILIYAIFKRRKLEVFEKNIIFTLICFSLLLFLLIGWTTPVLGAITRYRFPAQLALVLVGMIIVNPKQIKLWKNTSS